MEMMELAERCEKATGPDRKLEIDILSALGLGERIPGSEPDGSQDGWHNPDNDPVASKIWNCTASLDAAMSLVGEHSRFGVYRCRDWGDDTCRAWVHAADHGYCDGEPNEKLTGNGAAATPALALCAAALRSRAMKENGDE